MARIFKRPDFAWRGLGLHFGRRRRPVLTLVADAACPHLYRIRHPSGWTGAPANLARAKDAAYGHARHLLAEDTATEAPYSPETGVALAWAT
jgi:hypothetical protein